MNHQINLSTAAAMTKRFRQHRESILATTQQNKDILPICETFEKASIQAILDQQECNSFRVYLGMDEDLKVHAIFVGADSEGADILPASQTSLDDPGVIMEDGQRCPHYCPPESPLNAD